MPEERAAGCRRVGVEDAVVVGLAVLGEDLADALVRLVAVGLEARRDHPPAAERHDRPLQRRVGLQADDDLVALVDVARRMRRDARRDLRDVEDALLALLANSGCKVFQMPLVRSVAPARNVPSPS
jgi:hypothetical protein